MEIALAVVVIGSAGVVAALLYFVPRASRNAKAVADSGANTVQVAEQEANPSVARSDPAPQPPVEQPANPIYETVQPETVPQPVAASSSSAVLPFSVSSQPEQQTKPYRRRSNYTRTRSTTRTTHARKRTKQE